MAAKDSSIACTCLRGFVARSACSRDGVTSIPAASRPGYTSWQYLDFVVCIWCQSLYDPRRPERVFLREGSPESGMVYLEILRAKRRAQDDVDRGMERMCQNHYKETVASNRDLEFDCCTVPSIGLNTYCFAGYFNQEQRFTFR
ncbi:hypothetical protein [Legionella shakespearei]|uniref:Uncharacterized protein n=1 Tax=Legionella shakespearei DSM 23087 TaxID=1122169 RepID=A0A0W0YVZ3_9GAMM|nr:hypothetical protein [Legionella shakespearei]KTD61053.1 hypothetical protein Lsha_1300 [Legionella shakespearei DSM 23087]